MTKCFRCNGTGIEDTYSDYQNPYRPCSECGGRKVLD